jgi:hypothetical protein
LRQLGSELVPATQNLELARWLALTANARVHGTTGEVPDQRLFEEQQALQLLPQRRLGTTQLIVTPDRSFQSTFPVEALQHPLSVYNDLLKLA